MVALLVILMIFACFIGITIYLFKIKGKHYKGKYNARFSSNKSSKATSEKLKSNMKNVEATKNNGFVWKSPCKGTSLSYTS